MDYGNTIKLLDSLAKLKDPRIITPSSKVGNTDDIINQLIEKGTKSAESPCEGVQGNVHEGVNTASTAKATVESTKPYVAKILNSMWSWMDKKSTHQRDQEKYSRKIDELLHKLDSLHLEENNKEAVIDESVDDLMTLLWDGLVIKPEEQKECKREKRERSENPPPEKITKKSRGINPTNNSECLHGSTAEENEISASLLEGVLDMDRTSLDAVKQVCEAKGIPLSCLTYTPSPSFSLTLSYWKWREICDGERMRKGWANGIDEALEEIDFPCSFNVIDSERSRTKEEKFTLTGKCGGECQTRMTIKVDAGHSLVRLDVQVSGLDKWKMIQKVPTGRRLSYERRDCFKKRLIMEKPYRVFVDGKSKTLSRRFLHNNFEVQSASVLRKARSEGKRGLRDTGFLSEDIESLRRKMMVMPLYHSANESGNVPSGFVRMNSRSPMICSFFSPIQINYGLMCDTWYVDSTGSIVPNVDGKQTMLHSVIGRKSTHPGVPGVPVSEFLLNENSGANVFIILHNYVSQLRKVKQNYNPKWVITDFSFPYLHSLNKIFNGEDLMDHVNGGFDAMINGAEVPENQTQLLLCKLHVIHAFGFNMTKSNVNHEIRQLAMHAMANIQEARNLMEFEEATKHFIMLFGMNHITKKMQSVLVHELKYPSNHGPVHDSVKGILQNIETFSPDAFPGDNKTQKSRSKSYHYFEGMELQVEESLSRANELIRNEFYCSAVVSAMKDIYYPYVSLWTAAIPREVPPEWISPTKLMSTATAESYFRTHKHILHPDHPDDPVAYLEFHGTLVQGLVSESLSLILKSIPTKTELVKVKQDTQIKQSGAKQNPTKDKPSNIKFSESDSDFAEPSTLERSNDVWGKKKKKKGSLYQNRHTKKADDKGATLRQAMQGLNSALGKVRGSFSRKCGKNKKVAAAVIPNAAVPDESNNDYGVSSLEKTPDPINIKTKKVTRTSLKSKKKMHPKQACNPVRKLTGNTRSTHAAGEISDEDPGMLSSPWVDVEEDEKVHESVCAAVVTTSNPGPVPTTSSIIVPPDEYLPNVFSTERVWGTEYDLWSLCSTNFLNDNAIQAALEQLVTLHSPLNDDIRTDAVASTYTLHLQEHIPRDGGVVTYSWASSIKGLPDVETFDEEKGVIFFPTNCSSHWWLTTIRIWDKSICVYDTLPSHISTKLKNQLYSKLKTLLNEKYGCGTRGWNIAYLPMPRQPGGNECGPCTVASAEALLLNQDPCRVVHPTHNHLYRRKFIMMLLRTAPNGRSLIQNFGLENADNFGIMTRTLKSRRLVLDLVPERNLVLKQIQDESSKNKGSLEGSLIGTSLQQRYRTACLRIKKLSIGCSLSGDVEPYQIRSQRPNISDDCIIPEENVEIIPEMNGNASQRDGDGSEASIPKTVTNEESKSTCHRENLLLLDALEINEIIQDAGKRLQNILLGNSPSLRFQLFNDGNFDELNKLKPSVNPFLSMHKAAMREFTRCYMKYTTKDEEQRFQDAVLLPELLIATYAEVSDISLEDAEAELMM